MRGYPPDSALQAAAVAAGCGIRVLEITLDSPNAISVISRISESDSELVVGVGTVMESSQVVSAVAAGARFVVSPNLNPGVIAACAEEKVPAIPGAATPTEILTALDAGAVAVKVFPARQLGGPAYLAAIRGPLRNPPLIPTGGVEPETANDYLINGAVALGAGSSLFPARIGEERDWSVLETVVDRWIEAVS